MGEEVLQKFMNFNEPQVTFDEIFIKNYNIEPETLKEKEIFGSRFFLGDGSSGHYRCKTIIYCWHLINLDFNLIQKLQRYCTESWNGLDCKIYHVRKTSQLYRISATRKNMASEFDKFYTIQMKY